jgi:hypothetical protein
VGADLLQVAPAREARHALLEHEDAESAMPGLAGAHRGDDEIGVEPVGDERLCA